MNPHLQASWRLNASRDLRRAAERARIARSVRPMRRHARPAARAWRVMSLARIANQFARATAGGSH